MVAALSADAIVLLHLAFIVFVALGGLLALRWPWVVWVHLPAVCWGVAVELFGWICPLTPLENRLRAAAGDPGYTGGFIERYILPVVYPSQLTREHQLVLGAAVIIINLVIYRAVTIRNRVRDPQEG